MATRKRLWVHVSPYKRRGDVRVKGHRRRIRDRGAPGRTPKAQRWFEPEGRLIYKGMEWHASDPAGKRRRVLRGLVKTASYATTIRRLNALRNVSTSRMVDTATKADMDYLRRKYRPDA